MNDVRLLVDQLKKVGIQPIITINVDENTQDIQAIKTLHTNLKNAGITAQVQINLSATSTPGVETTAQEHSAASKSRPDGHGRERVQAKLFYFPKAR